MGIAENVSRINSCLGKGGIRLVAMAKGRSIAEINEALACGISEVGESRVQEAAGKLPLLPRAIIRHMAGRLQRNKVKEAIELFDVIQSVDSIALAQKIAAEASRQKKKITIYLQANVSGNPRQGGFAPAEIESAAAKIRELEGEFFFVGGLMAIAGMENPRRDSKTARRLADSNKLPVLSCGMSGDYEIAVSEGANMVRIGSAIFCPRQLK